MINFKLLSLRKYINGLLLWQRALVLLGMLLLLFILWLLLIVMPLQNKTKRLQQKINMHNQILAGLQKQLVIQQAPPMVAVTEKVTTKPPATINAKPIAVINELPKLLTDILNQQDNLILLSLDNVPTADADNYLLQQQRLYKHSMVLRFSGDYFATLEYLRALEKLNSRLYWDKLDYKVVKYPLAEVTLELHVFQNND